MIIENEKRSIDGMTCSVFENVKGLMDANTVVGKPVTAENGAVIIPISKVTLGIVCGGGEYGSPENGKYAGGNGVGMSVSPLAFLVSNGDEIKLVNVNDKSAFDKIVDAVPEVIKMIAEAIK